MPYYNNTIRRKQCYTTKANTEANREANREANGKTNTCNCGTYTGDDEMRGDFGRGIFRSNPLFKLKSIRRGCHSCNANALLHLFMCENCGYLICALKHQMI